MNERVQGAGEAATAPPIPWHAWTDDQALNELKTHLAGLSSEEAAARLAVYGRNELPAPRRPTMLAIVLHQLKSPLIYILMLAGVIALLTGDVKDAVFILAVIVLNTAIGAAQEHRAEKSAHALQEMLRVRARVRRDDQASYVDAEELVPGDIVLLESGDRVPADLRLIEVKNLAIDESFLTGEWRGATKRLEPLPSDVTVSDRRNMAYAGSTVISGRSVGLTVATGRQTEVGKIARTVAEETGAKPPLVLRMERFSRQISVVVLLFAGLLGLLSFLRGMAAGDVLLLVIAMAVSAIPEGLPVAMTVALSLATRRMAARNVIVRRLPAVESLGSCTVVASDKTGTLTVNQQTVRLLVLPDGRRVTVSGQGYNAEGEIGLTSGEALTPELRARLEAIGLKGLLCNEASLQRAAGGWAHSGDAMDVALLALAHKLGLDPAKARERSPALAQIPFESEMRFSAALHQIGDETVLIAKGAVETILQFCHAMATDDGERPLAAATVQELADELAGEGYRVLALASAPWPAGQPAELGPARLAGLTLQALTAFIDPLRAEVSEAVERARSAGIKVAMITGDHPATALAIAKELGIADAADRVVTGQDLAQGGAPGAPEVAERIQQSRVFARVSPDQKLQIVDAMVGMGDFVAVTGDGVNDAPALRKANIGVAMGSGTDVAKDTASLIVTDDNFASIVAGIEEGRHAYANVRKVTLLLISTGLAELILIGMSIFAGLPVPLLAVQILWLNLVTNGIQDVALAFEAGEPGVMSVPPRPPREGLFNRKMIEQVVFGGTTMALVCFAAWAWMMRAGWDMEIARGSLLTLLVLMQFYHVQNCRSESRSALRIPFRNNPMLMAGMGLAFGVHVLATETPLLQGLLRTQSIPVERWLAFAALGAILLAVMEVYKAVSRRRMRAPGRA